MFSLSQKEQPQPAEMENMRKSRLAAPVVKRKKLAEVEWKIIEDFCKGCGFCIEFCPVNALEESEKLSAKGVHPPKLKSEDACIGCGLCETICPDFAIYLEKKESEGEKEQ